MWQHQSRIKRKQSKATTLTMHKHQNEQQQQQQKLQHLLQLLFYKFILFFTFLPTFEEDWLLFLLKAVVLFSVLNLKKILYSFLQFGFFCFVLQHQNVTFSIQNLLHICSAATLRICMPQWSLFAFLFFCK